MRGIDWNAIDAIGRGERDDQDETCRVLATCSRWAGHRGQHGGFRPVPVSPAFAGLTSREQQALALIAHGKTYEQAAYEMGAVSPSTVKHHISNVRTKLEVQSVILALIAVGWLRPPEMAR